MRADAVPPTPPTTQIASQSPRRPHPQPYNGAQNHQYTNNYGNNFPPGAQQPRGPPRGGPNTPYQQQASYSQSPQKHNGRSNRSYSGQSPAATPQMAPAQLVMGSPQPTSWYPYYQPAYGAQQVCADFPSVLVLPNSGAVPNLATSQYPTQDMFYQYAQYGNNRYAPNVYATPTTQPVQPFYQTPERAPGVADQSPRVHAATMSPQPPAAASPVTSVQKPVSHAIKIINPATNAEVKIEKEVTTPVLAHVTPSPTPERIKTPITSASPVPSLGHSRQGSNTPVLTEDEKRERCEKAKAEVMEKINQSIEKERREKEEAERKKIEEEERLKKEEEERLQKEEAERLQKEEEERLKKEEEERLHKEEEERLRKEEEEERLRKEEEERLKREEAERLKEEQERLKKEEEERLLKQEEEERQQRAEEERIQKEKEEQEKEAAEAEIRKSAIESETPISTGTPATPESLGSPTLPAATVKESAIDASDSNDTSVAIAIKNATFIDDISAITYPSGINPPAPFKYDAAFLLQFQTVDWEQRTKNLQDTNRSASGAGRQGSRTPTMGQLGSMGQLGTKPSLLSSDQRFALSNARQGMDMSNPMGLNRTPSFGKMGNSTAQLSNMISSMSGMRNGRQGTVRGKRPGADRTPSSRGDATPTGADGSASGTSTPFSANRWKARRKNEPEEETAPDGSIIYAPDVVQRKMTLEKFDKISDQILEIVAQAKWESNGRTLRQKATDEAHWSNMYARFCKKVQESLGDDIFEEGHARGGALFRKYLLSKCWKVGDETAEGNGNTEVLTEEYYKAAAIKRKGLGLVRFVGELYILDMLSEKIMHRCIQNLLVAHPSEEEVESLCGLLRTIGAKLDNDRFHREHVDIYFSRMKDILDKEKLSSRIKFMIMDIFDLRKAQWKTKNADKGPKTIQQIHEEALKEQAVKELAKARTSNVRFR
ncbi:hypothetical protein V1525DRAFT_425904 [Lipomyces kononenkoae]|uniref:Uncharacterized protein n=1 Tax=Lipomyces kononenkoae TaxID=34357 RepID=A0ACC3T2B2_LIPKO